MIRRLLVPRLGLSMAFSDSTVCTAVPGLTRTRHQQSQYWHRTGSRWSPVRTLSVAPLWCDLGFFPNSRGNKAAANLRPMLCVFGSVRRGLHRRGLQMFRVLQVPSIRLLPAPNTFVYGGGWGWQVFRVLPVRIELLCALLCADLIR